MKYSCTNSLNLSFSLESGIEGREFKYVNAIAGGKGPRLYVL